MSAKHIVLGLLEDKPDYPYRLLELLGERSARDWRISSGQFYQTIKRLAEEGLIERVDGSSPGGRDDDDRHIFTITEAGLDEFERWQKRRGRGTKRSGRGTGARPLRRPVLAKLMFAGPEHRTETLEEIDAYELACSDELKELAREVDEIPAEGERVRADRVILKVALNLEIGQYEAELAWCPGARESLEWLYEQDAIWPSTHGRRPPQQTRTSQDSQGARKELFGRIAQHSPPTSTRQQHKRRS
jgi:DNA-binding PadR family transcriptional regulator